MKLVGFIFGDLVDGFSKRGGHSRFWFIAHLISSEDSEVGVKQHRYGVGLDDLLCPLNKILDLAIKIVEVDFHGSNGIK